MSRYVEHSIREVCKTNKEIVERIFDNAFSSRSSTEFSYRPIQLPPYSDTASDQGLNFSKLYPDYKEGDYVYIQCCMDGMYEREMMLLIQKTETPEVYFNGERKEVVQGPYGKDVYVNFKKGRNHVLIKVTAEKDGFAAYILPVVPGIRYIACGEYQYRTWSYIEKEGAKLFEGFEISRLYRSDENPPANEEIDWIYPIIPTHIDKPEFDFSEICTDGKTAYAYTHIEGKIEIIHSSPLKIFQGRDVLYNAEKGEFCADFVSPTPLLFKSINNGEKWGFRVEKCEKSTLPFVSGSDYPDLSWMWIGPFGRSEDSINVPYGPEVNLSFDKPYVSPGRENLLWHFYREKTYLKHFNHTAFFGQWYYAIMVGHYYMLQAAKKLSREDFYEFFIGSIGTMCNHRDYAVASRELFGESVYLAGSVKLDRLDPVGTIGMNIAEHYMMTADADAHYTLEKLANIIKHDVLRFPDGIIRRGKTMWTDDMYMSLPFLAKLGVIFGDERYFDDIVNQVRGFSERMYMDDCDLFSHIFFIEQQTPNRIPWGRGNGWVLLALSEVLLTIPGSYQGKEEIITLFQRLTRGVLKFRDAKEHLWHQVINNPDSYIETSGSAMFITALARGVINGWIDVACADEILESWEALCDKCIDRDGNVYGVCKGSSCSMDELYYLNLGTMINDDHGVGIVLSAGIEIMNLEEFIK